MVLNLLNILHIKKLDKIHLSCLGKVVRTSQKDHVLNPMILCRCELIGIETMLNRLQLRWPGYVTQMDDHRLSKLLGNGTKVDRGSGTKMKTETDRHDIRYLVHEWHTLHRP